MQCAACQRELPRNASFCPGCGARVDGAVASPLADAFVPEPSSPAVPATLAGGRYTLLQLLGEGGKKRVYLGHDRGSTARSRFAPIETRARPGRPLRIEREAQAMARLGDHPHIVTVHDVVEEGGAIYIVTQHMAGGDVARRIAGAPGGRLADRRGGRRSRSRSAARSSTRTRAASSIATSSRRTSG